MITSAMVGLLMWTGGGAISADPGALAQSSPAGSLPVNEATRRPIEGDALRTLLRDAYVTRALPPGVIVGHPSEIFRSNGFYRRFLSRTSVEGTFSIQDDLVCVEGPDLDRLCRRVFHEGNNAYTFVEVATGLSTPMSVARLPMPTPNEATRPPIEGDALRTLLRDVFVALPRAPGVLTRQLGEVFRYNGAYERIAYWGRRQGTFSIEGDAVCIEGPSLARQCRRVILLSDDNYSLVDVEDGTSAIVTISPLP